MPDLTPEEISRLSDDAREGTEWRIGNTIRVTGASSVEAEDNYVVGVDPALETQNAWYISDSTYRPIPPAWITRELSEEENGRIMCTSMRSPERLNPCVRRVIDLIRANNYVDIRLGQEMSHSSWEELAVYVYRQLQNPGCTHVLNVPVNPTQQEQEEPINGERDYGRLMNGRRSALVNILDNTNNGNRRIEAYNMLRGIGTNPDRANAIIEYVMGVVDRRRIQNERHQHEMSQMQRDHNRCRRLSKIERSTGDIKHRKSRPITNLQVRVGWEFECTNARLENEYGDEEDFNDSGVFECAQHVSLHGDGSVNGRGFEFVLDRPLSPLLAMRRMGEFIEEMNPCVDKSCGLHFHISIRPMFTDEMSEEILKRIEKRYNALLESFINNTYVFGRLYEERLFENLPKSRLNNNFCRKISREYSNMRRRKGNVRQKMGRLNCNKYSNDLRYVWLNFVEMYRDEGLRTVEFRALGETTRMPYIYAVFAFFLELVYRALILDLKNNPDSMIEATDALNTRLKAIKQVRHASDWCNIQAEARDSFMITIKENIKQLQQCIQEITI